MKAYNLMINLPGSTPEIQELLKISCCIYIFYLLSKSFSDKDFASQMSHNDFIEIQKAEKVYAGEYLSCSRISRRQKINFWCKVFLPVPIVKIIMNLVKFLRFIRNKLTKIFSV
ncbi:MAG: hypothetical protein IJP48_09755 [Synergistaceae bacterium]|nr:hypothetical protein [Synergistaceae bacterium]